MIEFAIFDGQFLDQRESPFGDQNDQMDMKHQAKPSQLTARARPSGRIEGLSSIGFGNHSPCFVVETHLPFEHFQGQRKPQSYTYLERYYRSLEPLYPTCGQ